MSPLLPLMLLGGTVLILTNRGGGNRKEIGPGADPAPSAKPPAEGVPGKGPVTPPPDSTTDGKCILPEQKDLSNLPDDGFWNAFRYALLMDSNPVTLRGFAASCQAVCQPTAAKALLDKADTLEKAGVPPGYSPSGVPKPGLPGTFSVPGLPVPVAVPTGFDPTGGSLPPFLPSAAAIPESFPFPIPGVEGSPDPTSPVPAPALPGLGSITPEAKPKTMPDTPKSGIRSWASTQWWSGALKSGESPWGLAQAITGDGNRYPELFPANPEKATVMVKTADGKSYPTFASFKIGERIRIPKGWNIYTDQKGRADGKGTIWPADPEEPVSI